jgi:beta-glucosidase
MVSKNIFANNPTNVYQLKAEAGKSYDIEITFSQGNSDAVLNFDFGTLVPIDMTASIAKVRDADVVVFAGGISPSLEGEEMRVTIPGFKGGDRTDIELPVIQRRMLQALKQAGKKVIFVNYSGSALGLVPETQSCMAILQAWYPGQAGGTAIANVLFGDTNPSGHLPVTFYKSVAQLPDFENYSMKGRTYRYMTEKPQFSFGYGLTYTTFRIGKAKPCKTEIKNDETLELTIPVSNTGKRDGAELVQVYVHKVNDTDGPFKTLRGFKRVDVKAGKTNPVTIELPSSSFEFYDRSQKKMTVTSGEYEVYYGNSSDSKDLKMTKITVL